ncbi:mandelate racemase/muconate lactonizing enzyme family protein [Ancylobacter dichloromethanicus]|uniref:D-galactarolactone cycloisomerase n=1 Tax=Ancylobacter dichloromethanicus TaxID=518825 RepID=A0A9W6JAM7_9HYPH|nr:mandelate racemase/muconate lactonizing enzyme family protein [Ancylobacter dichloromethanicus]MBS7554744.1 mandelate racemase/muconate lactonizing enzyme family protein [Ancylobacter dichloromethanicus]GLK72350.1 D-galactarolactone cycloisomerase [Ancylobacter dichloromethanicus]
MRIAAVHTHVLEAALSKPFGWSFDNTRVRGACIVEIVTDTGLVGWGECYGPARMNAAVIDGFRRHLIGADPMAGEALWQTLHSRFRDYGQRGLVIAALSGIDIALWDLRGKALGVPVHRLMGGPLRTRVQAYATGTYRLEQGDPLDYVIEEVRGYVEEGFEAVKLKIGLDLEEDIALIRATRAAIGPGRQLMLDANHGFDALDAIALGRRVADQNIAWFEEPVIPEDLASYREVKAGQPIPVAGGECTATRWGFLDILATRAVDIVQPDTAAAGGLTECKKIADMAAAFGVRYIPHVWGTGIGLAAALQLLAVLPHTPPRHTPREPLLEFDRSEHPFRQAVLTSPIEHVRGWVDIPTGPGLGIEIDRAALARFAAA